MNKMSHQLAGMVLLGGAFISSLADARQTVELHSTTMQNHLLELFSSEGCSSCPPADAWLAKLRHEPGLWTKFIPVEFHVDYWNRLGWQDRFSRQIFTKRQAAYGEAWGTGRVYTPAFVLDGAEWTSQNAATLAAYGPANVGILSATESQDQTYHVVFKPTKYLSAPNGWTAYAALLGNGVATHVTAGENQGSILHHEFVVLNLATLPMQLQGAEAQADLSLKAPAGNKASGYSLAVWVTRTGEQKAVQAVGGDLP